MKLLGIDYGAKKVGIAVSDDGGVVAFPKAIFPNDKGLVEVLALLSIKEGIQGVVVGKSQNYSGGENPIAREATSFTEALSRRTGLKIFFENEAFTSVEARRFDGKEAADDRAAALILQRYLDRENNKKAKNS